MIKRVYIAGRLSNSWDGNNPAVGYLTNARLMMEMAVRLMRYGFTPFCPALDMLLFFVDGADQLDEKMIKKQSIEWLSVCDAILLLPKWQDSPGTLKEIEFAKQHSIPVFEGIGAMIFYNKGN